MQNNNNFLCDTHKTGNIIDYDSNLIIIYDIIDERLSSDITEFMINSSKSNENIYLRINSPGGDLYHATAIISEFIQFKNDIIVDITGVAFSSAAMIALCGNHIKISNIGLIMLHYPSWENSYKSFHQHELDVNATKEHFERTIKFLLSNTKLSFEEFKKKQKDFYITPKQALRYGLVDEIY